MHAPVDFERLIELVRPYPFLFDRNEPDFKDVALKNQRWRLIGAEFGISGEHAAQKFRTMKTKYKDLRRAHEAATGNRSKPPRWRYYKLMDDFLRERYLPEHMASPAGMVISNIRSFAELQTEDAAARSASHVSSAEVRIKPEPVGEEDISWEDNSEDTIDEDVSREDDQQQQQQQRAVVAAPAPVATEQQQHQDEFHHFGMMVADRLRRLPRLRALSALNAMHQALFEHETAGSN